jgi:hypothetical protein
MIKQIICLYKRDVRLSIFQVVFIVVSKKQFLIDCVHPRIFRKRMHLDLQIVFQKDWFTPGSLKTTKFSFIHSAAILNFDLLSGITRKNLRLITIYVD